MTVLYVVIGLLAVTLVSCGIGAYVFVHSETGQKIISTTGEGINMAREATRAPGTDALRERACSQAMVMPFGRMFELFRRFGALPPEELEKAGLPGNGTVIFCQLGSDRVETPACADVARIYATAVPEAPERFGVVVQRQGDRKSLCEGTYARDGTLVQSLDNRK
jgi:hypothetical protein